MSVSLGDLAERFGCEVRGDTDTRITRVATLVNAGPGCITFLANPAYRKFLKATKASAVILADSDVGECPTPALLADNPYLIYARVATLLNPPAAFEPGVSQHAVVEAGAEIAADAGVAHGAVIEQGAVIGAGSMVGPRCVVGRGARIGRECRLTASVTLCHDVHLGDRCIVHPGAVIGADGFGIAQDGEGWEKVPQLGSVRIGDDVEIGANTTIDRGAIDDTVIGAGVKLDNQIQIGHNVQIGEHTVVAGCAGISGSTSIGKRCMIAGASGIAGHLEIADDVILLAASVVLSSIPKPGVYASSLTHDDARRWRKNSARFKYLDDMARQTKRIERDLEKVKKRLEQDDE
ncbi:MAG: UDP-3-O-(3-hydroxymyristoyl)glucosamine N-acyltransferase [Gammaproteobacteria bacterium]|nr:MAG: UDP-3-O-(3-hydroxymyristoyl)glucosamine N-acyltransferase [Gammaproteobacteria bacterium]